ncbi:hypothetical protein WJT74_08590 [Sphingomicrobium sp. XHP0239]|uniref:hypothetical protein n=1 Tax=Sphingomicrobium maritimum TaxID=3133972 RepID=UPI0031CCAD35
MKQTFLIAPALALALAACATESSPALIVPASIAGTSVEEEWRELAAQEQGLIEDVDEASDEVEDAERDLRDARNRLASSRDDLQVARDNYRAYESAPSPVGDPETVAAEQRRRADAAEAVSDAQDDVRDRSNRVDRAERDLAAARSELEQAERNLADIRSRRENLEYRY